MLLLSALLHLIAINMAIIIDNSFTMFLIHMIFYDGFYYDCCCCYVAICLGSAIKLCLSNVQGDSDLTTHK